MGPFFIIWIFIIMRTKLIITESQFNRLKTFIAESDMYSSIVKQMKNELDANYLPDEKFVRKGGDYSATLMIIVNVSDELITVKDLFEYMKFKYKMGDDFTKQVITDWIYGKITDDYQLSKIVPLN